MSSTDLKKIKHYYWYEDNLSFTTYNWSVSGVGEAYVMFVCFLMSSDCHFTSSNLGFEDHNSSTL